MTAEVHEPFLAPDAGHQYASLTDAEKVVARADLHMAGCDEEDPHDCEVCRSRLERIRQHLAALDGAGLLLAGERLAGIRAEAAHRAVCWAPNGKAGHACDRRVDHAGLHTFELDAVVAGVERMSEVHGAGLAVVSDQAGGVDTPGPKAGGGSIAATSSGDQPPSGPATRSDHARH